MIRRFPIAIAATTLALSLTASASILGDSQLGQVAEQLKTALAGDPVEVTQRVVLVRLTSGADAMFPSGGWQVPSNVPLLDKMLPTLSKLQNTKIVVAGYTDNVPVGEEHLRRRGFRTTSTCLPNGPSPSRTTSPRMASRRISSRRTRSGKPTQWRRTTPLKDGRRTVGSTSRWPATAHNQLAHCFVCLRVACKQTSNVVPFAIVQAKNHSCILRPTATARLGLHGQLRQQYVTDINGILTPDL